MPKIKTAFYFKSFTCAQLILNEYFFFSAGPLPQTHGGTEESMHRHFLKVEYFLGTIYSFFVPVLHASF